MDVKHFDKFLGGSPTNVAVAAARLGEISAAHQSHRPRPLRRFVHEALREFRRRRSVRHRGQGLPNAGDVLRDCFRPITSRSTSIARRRRPTLRFMRMNSTIDAILKRGSSGPRVSGLSVEPSRSATLLALKSRQRRQPTVLDLDYRPMFWSSREDARARVREALGHSPPSPLAISSEVEVAVESADPDVAADRLLELGLSDRGRQTRARRRAREDPRRARRSAARRH